MSFSGGHWHPCFGFLEPFKWCILAADIKILPVCPYMTHITHGVYTPYQHAYRVGWPGRWPNASTFVFCPGDCPFKCKPSPTSADACGEVTGCDASHQKVGMCSSKGGSQGMYITFTPAKKLNKVEPTLTLKPWGDIWGVQILFMNVFFGMKRIFLKPSAFWLIS